MTSQNHSTEPAHSSPARSPIEISPESKEPLYRQLRHALEHQIISGAMNPNVALPSSRYLANELGFSRNTVNAAIQELVATGLIEARPRSGHFINTTLLAGGPEKDDRTRLSDGSIDWEAKIRPIPDRHLPQITKTKNWQTYPYPFVPVRSTRKSSPDSPGPELCARPWTPSTWRTRSATPSTRMILFSSTCCVNEFCPAAASTSPPTTSSSPRAPNKDSTFWPSFSSDPTPPSVSKTPATSTPSTPSHASAASWCLCPSTLRE